MVIPSMCRKRVQVYQMTLVLLADSSTTGIGVASLVLGSLCFFTKSQSMQEMLAPLSTRARILMAFNDWSRKRS